MLRYRLVDGDAFDAWLNSWTWRYGVRDTTARGLRSAVASGYAHDAGNSMFDQHVHCL